MADLRKENKDVAWDPVDPFDQKDTYFWVKIEHLARYLFAADYLKDRQSQSIADISCGMGYGLAELEPIAEQIIGVDNSQKVLEIAEKQYSSAKARFVQCELDDVSEDLTNKLGEKTLTSIVCFETLEHLVNPSNTLQQFSRVLKPQGHLVCSVPNVLFEYHDSAGLPLNTYHKQFFNYASFSRLLKQYGFSVLYRVGQSWTNTLFKRENQFLQDGIIKKGIGEYTCVNDAEIIRLFARVLAYPTVEDVEGSYSIIVVAQKGEDANTI